MKRFRNVLYVTEPRVDQASAIARAAALAENNQARLTVLHVADKPRLGSLGDTHRPDEIESLLRQQELERLEALIAPHRARVEIALDTRFGTPFIEVVRDVLRNDRDLVVKAACVADGVRDHLFGTTDMHLLRKCPCPVWIMRQHEKANYTRILAAVDFDPWQPRPEEEVLNRRILELAGSLAMSDFAELHLVHAWDPIAEGMMRVWGNSSTEENIAAYVESERSHHAAGLDRLSGKLRGWIGGEAHDYLAPRLHLPRGNAREVIPALAANLEADLVVMGTVGRTGIRGFIIGNTAEGILNHIGCSVLAVKPDGFVSPVELP